MGSSTDHNSKAKARTSDPGPKFALVVDDLPMILTAVKAFLERRNFTVLTARDGAEALALAPTMPFSIIITDIEMPIMDGIEATRRIRGLGGSLASIPIVAFSARRPALTGEQQQEAGIDCFVPKDGGFAPLAQALASISP